MFTSHMDGFAHLVHRPLRFWPKLDGQYATRADAGPVHPRTTSRGKEPVPAADPSQICHRCLVSMQSRPLAAKEGLCARHPNTIHGRPRTLNRPTRRLEPSGGNGPTAKFAIRVVVCGAIDEPCAVDKARSRRSLEILRACWITFIQIVRRRHIAAQPAVYGGGPSVQRRPAA